MHWVIWVKPPPGFEPRSPAWEADDLPTELSLPPYSFVNCHLSQTSLEIMFYKYMWLHVQLRFSMILHHNRWEYQTLKSGLESRYFSPVHSSSFCNKKYLSALHKHETWVTHRHQECSTSMWRQLWLSICGSHIAIKNVLQGCDYNHNFPNVGHTSPSRMFYKYVTTTTIFHMWVTHCHQECPTSMWLQLWFSMLLHHKMWEHHMH